MKIVKPSKMNRGGFITIVEMVMKKYYKDMKKYWSSDASRG